MPDDVIPVFRNAGVAGKNIVQQSIKRFILLVCEANIAGVNLFVVRLRDVLLHFIIGANTKHLNANGAGIHIVGELHPRSFAGVPSIPCFGDASINGTFSVDYIMGGGIAFKKDISDVFHVVWGFWVVHYRTHEMYNHVRNFFGSFGRVFLNR